MSFIGRTHGKIKENVRDNLYSPVVLAILSNKYNFHYTYLGTVCIFESDVPNFFGSFYSVVKGYIDRL